MFIFDFQLRYNINTKCSGANYIYNLGKLTKVIKTSIIGPELRYKVNLLEWFLNQEGKKESLSAPWVIGCDGFNSVVRTAAEILDYYNNNSTLFLIRKNNKK